MVTKTRYDKLNQMSFKREGEIVSGDAKETRLLQTLERNAAMHWEQTKKKSGEVEEMIEKYDAYNNMLIVQHFLTLFKHYEQFVFSLREEIDYMMEVLESRDVVQVQDVKKAALPPMPPPVIEEEIKAKVIEVKPKGQTKGQRKMSMMMKRVNQICKTGKTRKEAWVMATKELEGGLLNY